ncbi:MAG TPA: GNAT family N-acetyltransferase [bacterium]|nr:GNAT family N-acetyltransferase [bacterium]HPT29985.1 GNAT family N-acetyltransferase [bacterium]
MNDIEIILGNREDLDKIVALNQEIFKSLYQTEPYSLQKYQERLSSQEPTIYLVKSQGSLIGNSIAFPREGDLYLWILGVHQDYRHQGVATQLLILNEQEAEKSGYPKVVVKVYNVSKDMLRLLLGRGYHIVGVETSAEDAKYNAINLEKII